MTLKLFVTKKSDNQFSEDYEFKSFPIFMGRDSKNEVILPDAYKIISRKHAKISEKENTVELTDLESANFTYLNGEKLEANKEYHLSSGDKIKISDYELNIEIIKEEIISDDNQKTMLFSSPFADEIAVIAENLKALSSKFSIDNSPMKTDMLKYSIMQSLHSLERNDSNKILAEFFSENFLGNSRHTAAEQKKHEFSISSHAENESYRLIRNEENYKTPPVHDPSFSMHFSNSICTADTFAKLVRVFFNSTGIFGVNLPYIAGRFAGRSKRIFI
jgi:pSer/pThr/pTyr-binding forkhead associated (FHA) protein